LNFTITGETVGSIQVLTEGAPNLDFKQSASAGTCTAGVYTSATACTVNVTFAPTVPGERQGAVVFYDDSGNVLSSLPINGTGIAPQVAFNPGTQTVLAREPNGVVVDAIGDVYFSDSATYAVEEIPAGCASSACQTTIGGGFNGPAGLAIDGMGNIYVADFYNSAVKRIPSGCTSASCVITLGGGFNRPDGVAVDGIGNVYVSDVSSPSVKEMPANCSSASCVSTLAGGFSSPMGVAVDGNGNVYVADDLTGVREIPAGCVSSSCVKTLGGGSSDPSAVALDSANNVYVANGGSGALMEMPAGCSSSECVTTLAPFSNPAGVALDGNGNIYVADAGDGQLIELNRAAAPALTFASTNAGSISTDSPKTVTAENIGNTGLNISTLNYAVDFPESQSAPKSDCVPDSTLAPGASCTLTIEFWPLTTSTPGLLSEDVQLVDNNLWVFNSVQQIPVSGTEIGLQASTPAFSLPSGTYGEALSVTITDATPSPAIYYTTDGTTPVPDVGTTQPFTGPIAVNVTTTLKAVARAADYTLSAVATAKYTIDLPPAKKPTFKPAAGTYHAAQRVTIEDTTPDAAIYYTTNGTTPTSGSTLYNGLITVSSSETIKAIAIAPGFSTSEVATAKYTIDLPHAKTPTFKPAAGTYHAAQHVTIEDTTAGATIYYTTNGKAPTTSSAVYGGPIVVSSSQTIEAIAVAPGFSNSALAKAKYDITPK
jgi:sugar lactone lactonase YvrE